MNRILKSLFFVVVGVAVGCSSAQPTDPNAASTDRASEEALDAIPQFPHTAVCADASARFHCKARVRSITMNGKIQPDLGPNGGFGPTELKNAYKIDTTRNPGATIAIVDAFGYPNAESDLATYRSNFGLPPCTKANGCLKIVNDQGQTSPLPPAPAANDDWTVEAALDLDMASAACPNCKLILVQATDDTSDSLFVSQQTAASLGATVISDSWGGSDPSPSTEEHFFQTTPSVGIFVSSGDSGNTGSSPDYPSTSAFVTGVGGTSLRTSTNSRGFTETAWSGAGSSCSTQIAKPSFQTNSACSHRAAADVSAVADPNTGVAVFNNGPSSSGWIVVGGTSASSPFVAGVFALYGKGNVGPSYSYANPSQFFDVTSGSNGTCTSALCKAAAGWDGPTGNGTPNGTLLGGGVCTPQCTGKTCGPDGCGGTCGTCASGQTCSAAGTCTTSTCTHNECSTGGRLKSGCDSCVTSICAADSFCCSVTWDSICVSEVSSICHQTCP